MGYTTEFVGSIRIEPPLTPSELEYVNAFSSSRRMDRTKGPYHVGGGFRGQANEDDVVNHNGPPKGQPSLWCQWVASEDGSELVWDQGEKFYDSPEWMAYMRSHFIVGLAAKYLAPEALGFLTPHAMSGMIHAVGESVSGDVWRLTVDDEGVWVSRGAWSEKVAKSMGGGESGEDEDEEEDRWDSMPSMVEAVKMASNPANVAWEDWVRVTDYADPETGRVVAALRDKEAVEAAAGAGKAGSSALSL